MKHVPGNNESVDRRSTSVVAAVLLAAAFAVTGCSEQKPPPPQTRSTTNTEAGVAGGVTEETQTASVVVSAIDPATRRLTFTNANGEQMTYTAGPEIRNFPQIRVGDKVTATFTRRYSIDVRSGGPPPSESYVSADSVARPGEKPGAMTREEVTIVSRVQAIDSANRVATLQFSDGSVRKIPVRPDVDLSRYKVGDSVVTRMTTALSVLVEGQ